MYLDEISCPPPETGAGELGIDGLDFVRRFSKINVSTNQVLGGFSKQAAKDALLASVYSGNSRDQVSMRQFSCQNVSFGCSYHHSFYSKVLAHQRTCKVISTEALARLNEVKAFPCDRGGCGQSFSTNARRNNHIAELHDWKPRACNKDGYDPSYVFQSIAGHSRHVEHVHSPYAPTKCQYPGCTSQASFATSKTYRGHLLRVHGLTDRKERQVHAREEAEFCAPEVSAGRLYLQDRIYSGKQTESASSSQAWLHKRGCRILHVLSSRA
jgi:hypothetical protein